MPEIGDNLIFSTLFTKNCIRIELNECKRIKSKRYPSIGISDNDDIELLEALRIYKNYLIKQNKRDSI